MTQILEPQVDAHDVVAPQADQPVMDPPAPYAYRGAEPGGPSRRARFAAWFVTKRGSIPWLLPLLALTALVQFINLGGSPQRVDDEGTYTAQAYAIDKLGELTHYTYWYDHPPLGWMQIAGWTKLTDGFARYDVAVLAAREFMVVMAVVSAGLLWMLGRRLGMSRVASGVAVAIFALSPLAVQYHRTVFLDNVATPWLLAAFVLVFAPRRQLLAFAAAAVCFAVAVLSKETYFLFLPFLAWQMWRMADRGTRRYTVSLAAAIVVLLGFSYVLLSVIKGELFPGMNRVSLLSGIGFQLGGREASGSFFDAGSQARVTLGQWVQLDPVILVAGPLAALLALRDKRFRPIAAAVVFLVLFTLRPGYLPIPYVIALLPFFALLVPGVVESIIRRARTHESKLKAGLKIIAVSVVAATALALAAPMWAVQLRGLLLADLDAPMRQAQTYVQDNVDRDYRLVVDDSMWVDLVRTGFNRQDVVWYYKVDTDPAVSALAPNGWRDYDYVVSTNSIRTFPDGSPTVAEALTNSVPVATFGTGDKAVTVFRVQRQGIEAANAQAEQDRQARVATGEQLVENPALDLPQGVQDLITGGRVDARVMIALPRAATLGTLTVSDVPAVYGEEDLQRPRRQMLISAVDGDPVAGSSDLTDQLTALLTEQPAPFAPRTVTPTDAGLLVTYDVDGPTGLLGTGGGS